MHGPQDGAPAAGGAELLLTSLLVLALVCAVTWIALRFLRTWLDRRRPATGVAIVGRIPLEPRRSLFIIDAAGRRLLLGSSEGGITLLTELAPADEAAPSPPASGRFADLLRAAISSRRIASPTAPPPPVGEPIPPSSAEPGADRLPLSRDAA